MSGESATSTDTGLPVAEVAQTLGIWLLFGVTILAGVRLAPAVIEAGLQFTGDSTSVLSLRHLVVPFVAGLVVFFLLQRYDKGRVALKTFFGLYLAFLFGQLAAGAGLLATPLAYVPGLVGIAVLWAYPEWYVMDAVGVFFGASLAAMLGVSYGPLPALVALVAWAAYDAYAVYQSDAMKTLAAAGLDISLPGAFYIPDRLDASLIGRDLVDDADSATDPSSTTDASGAADASEAADASGTADSTDTVGNFKILGVGDAMVPGFLVVSAVQFLDPAPIIAGLSLPALGAFLGSFVGLLGIELLLRYIDRIHAGLPVLNTTTILGYLGGAVAAGIPLTTALGL